MCSFVSLGGVWEEYENEGGGVVVEEGLGCGWRGQRLKGGFLRVLDYVLVCNLVGFEF